MSVRRLLPIALLSGLFAAPGSAAALSAKLSAPGCPAAADCVDPEDRTTVTGGPDWTATGTVLLNGFDMGTGVGELDYVLDGGPETRVPRTTLVDLGADGTHVFSRRALDRAGNSSEWVTTTVKLDRGAPTDTTTLPSGYHPGGSATVTFTGADAASGLDRLEVRIDGGTTQTLASGDTRTITGDGNHLVEHRAVDAVGNASPWVSGRVLIDTTAPTDTSAGPTGWAADQALVTLAGTDAVAGVDVVRWRVPGGSTQTALPGAQVPVSTPGTSTVETQVVDKAGNASAWKANVVRVDSADPTDTTSVPTGWQTSASVGVPVSGTDGQSGVDAVEWILDDPTVRRATGASTTVTVTGDGTHALQTRIVDLAGRRSAWRAQEIRIDSTPPTNNTATPTGWSRTSPVELTLDGADGGSGLARIEWSVDGGTVVNGVKGTVVRVAGDGAHTLLTTAVDVAGRRTSVSAPVKIDTTAPADTTVVPARTRYGSTGRIPVTGTDALSGVGTVEWKLDGIAGGGPSGSLVDAGAPGEHVLEHRVLDAAGNATPWVTSRVVVDPALNLDTVAPVDTTAPPVAWQTVAQLDVPVTGTDAGTAVDKAFWRLGGSAVQSGPSGSTVRVSGDGEHRFETRVSDLAGNLSDWKDQVVRLDATAPEDTTVVPSGWVRSATLTLTGTDATSGLDRMEWWIGSGTRQFGPSGATTAVLPEGTTSVEHRAVDVAGNVSARRRDTVKVDSIAPVDTSPAAPAGWQTDPWSFAPAGTDAGSGVDGADVEVDGKAVTARPVVVDADGTHAVRSRVRDVAGNASAWRSQTVKVDRTAPADTTPTAPTGWSPVPWEVTQAADDGAGSGVALLEHRIGDAAVATGALLRVAAEGTTVVRTRATDLAGHVGDWREQTVRVDTADPTVALTCAPAAAVTGHTCAISATDATSGVSALRWRVAGGPWQDLDPAGATIPVDSGVVEAEATDAAGHTAGAASQDLPVRRAPAPAATPKPVVTPRPTATPAPAAKAAKTRRVTVRRRGTKGIDGTLGSFVLALMRPAGQPAQGVADVRPLALGKGRHTVTIRLASGQLGARRSTTVKLGKGGGYSKRVGVALAGVTKTMTATLVVKRAGKVVATAKATLKP